MPFVSTISKNKVAEQYNTIKLLEKSCKSCKLFVRREPEYTIIYSIHNPDSRIQDSMVAISKYGKTYAMRTPENLSMEGFGIFEFVLRDLETDEEIVVFSRKDYDAVKAYLRDKENKVIMYV